MPRPDPTLSRRQEGCQALLGLLGAAVLWFYHWSFLTQFDPAKIARITDAHPLLDPLLEALRYALAPGETSAVVAGVLCGQALRQTQTLPPSPAGRTALVARRLYPVYLVALLPLLSYTQASMAQALPALVFMTPLPLLPELTWFLLVLALSVVVLPALPVTPPARAGLPMAACALALLALGALVPVTGFVVSVAAGYGLSAWLPAPPEPRRPLPALACACCLLAGCLVPLPVGPRAVLVLLAARTLPVHLASGQTPTARVLAHQILRFYGRVALPFFLVHGAWGFRLSRSILQGELHSLGAIAAHYALSLVLASCAAYFLHVFFERPARLRYDPPTATRSRPPIKESP